MRVCCIEWSLESSLRLCELGQRGLPCIIQYNENNQRASTAAVWFVTTTVPIIQGSSCTMASYIVENDMYGAVNGSLNDTVIVVEKPMHALE
jgi:hypothetical protein